MLSGFTARIAHALQVNLEYSTDVLCRDRDNAALSASAKEARRRLMWACFVLDTWTGSGVDQLTLIDERDIQIQLPCNEGNFLLQIPCLTEVLEARQTLPFLPPDPSLRPSDNMGMMAYYIRLIVLWKRVLR